jgi:ribonuclease R
VSPPAPSAGGTFVAVLEKRGRFLVAERLFPLRDEGDRGGRARRRDGGLVVDARGAPGGRRAGPGDLVLVQVGGRGRRGGGPAGHARIARIIGRPDVARDVIEGLMLDRGMRRAFDPAVRREARGARDAGRSPASAGGRAARRDLRELATFTIDPVTARDFDDAISAEQIGEDTVRVWVHIADVSAYVPEDSLLDREARRRGTSVYVPGAVEPMLPEEISNEACSLVPAQDRLAVTVELVLRGATVEQAAFYRSLIRSDARLDYERVDRIFDGSEPAHEPWVAPLAAARRAAAALEAARERRRGALTLDRPEPEFRLDADGHVAEISGRVTTESHRLIEHLMIAANEAVARHCNERSVPTLYRVHERPDPERVERLVDQLASLGVSTPPVPEHLAASQAAALMGDVSARVDAHVRRTGYGRLGLTLLVLRALKQAYYSPANIGHAGLGSPCYCHFTSPIRRYPDLVCHRALLSTVGGGEAAPRAAGLRELGEWTSDRERAAMLIERDADDIARCFALEQLLYAQGWDLVFDGEITGIIGAGAFVSFGLGELDERVEIPVYEGMLPVRRLDAGVLRGGEARGAGAPGGDAGDRTRSRREEPARGGRPRRPAAGADRGRGGDRVARGAGTGADRGGSPAERDWWELNEEGTILFASRSGAALRLGDEVHVQVHRVEPVRGRVDLGPPRGAYDG